VDSPTLYGIAPIPERAEATSWAALAVEMQKLAAIMATQVAAINDLSDFIKSGVFLQQRHMCNSMRRNINDAR
jgi:hypothetical protein